MLDLILKYGLTHDSPLGHAQFTFTLDGVSRACTHQIVRNQVGATYSQKSQRYVTETGQFEYYTPDKIKTGDELGESYDNFMEYCQYFYDQLIKKGIPAEEARYILPNAATSSMTVSYTLRALINVANLRLCTKAQKEIRDVVKQMCELVIEKEPWLAEFLAPKCYKLGHCDEKNGCGIFPAKVKHGKIIGKRGNR